MLLLKPKRIRLLYTILYFLLLFLLSCVSKTTSYNIPPSIDLSAKYLFFLHGTITEMQGSYGTHPVYGTYDFQKMVKAFSDQGFTVITEIRARDTDILIYAHKVTEQVNNLLAQGVLPENIGIVGFSKGGAITLQISSILKQSKVNFVVMAGCGATGKYKNDYNRFLENSASDLQGRILSIYDTKDSICGSCEAAFNLATGKILSKEIKLVVGKGHGTFYQPRQEWLIPVVKWINESKE